MICVYDIDNIDFEKNGDAVLTPTSGTIKQVAAGKYTLDMVHPIDQWGKWEHLVPEAIIRAPIPAETIENAFSGLEADLYVTTEQAALRSGPSEPQTINYGAWTPGASYAVGAKVTSNNKNYQLNSELTDGERYTNPAASGKWSEIARMTPGSPMLISLKTGSNLYFVESYDTTWNKMSTLYGLEGYIRKNQIEFVKHLTPDETGPRTIDTQLFRIKTVNVDTTQMQVTVSAEHVSYDLNGVLIKSVKVERQPPAYALAWIEQSFMMDYEGMLATDMVESEDASYTAEISGKSGMYALLDPDKGVVAAFDAKFTRDNWDLFIMAKTDTDRGFRLRYGNNVQGINWKKDSTQLITRVVPVAKDEDGSELYLEDPEWVDSELIDDYPKIRMERIKVEGQVGKDDGSETGTMWTAAALREEMAKKAQSRFDVDKVDQIKHDITVDFTMLGDTAEYEGLKGLQEVLLYDKVLAIDERIGLSVTVEVQELEYDIIRKKIRTLKLTNIAAYNGRNVSGFNVLNNSITGDKLTDEAGSNLVSEAVGASEEYTQSEINNVRAWVRTNFEPKA